MKLIPLNTRPLRKNKKWGFFAQVDDADFEWLNQWNWQAKKEKHTYYAWRRDRTSSKIGIAVFMHREILGLKKGDGKFGDHRDHNGLNNQRFNLRIATKSENMRNKIGYGVSKYKGVSLNKNKRRNKVYARWMATIKINGNQKTIGRFETQEEAALAYNKIAKKLHGKFAKLNIIG